MPQRKVGIDVFQAALDRLIRYYSEGHRIVVSISGGKDSTVCMELAILAAEATGRLPVEVITRDEEIMFPGTFEYVDRVWHRPEVDLRHIIANQPIINAFNRDMPYWWVFDPAIDPEQWVRQPPGYAVPIVHKHIGGMVNPIDYPPPPGKDLIAVTGLRVQESVNRRMSIASSKGALTKPTSFGIRLLRPIYDWTDADVWKAMRDLKWDYNTAYTTLYRMGAPRGRLRIGPPTINTAGIDQLQWASRAWPTWFDRVCKRLDGVRTAAQFGKRAVEADRRHGESWEDCYRRTCIDDAPEWVRTRALEAMDIKLRTHRNHSTLPFPDTVRCDQCGNVATWKALVKAMYMGDPFALKMTMMKPVEPEFFRPGAGSWIGKDVAAQ